MRTKILFFVALFLSVQLIAQPKRELVKVIVTPNQSDWTYETGERAEFTISVLKNNVSIDGIEVSYRIQPEKVDVWDEGTLIIKDGSAKIKDRKNVV